MVFYKGLDHRSVVDWEGSQGYRFGGIIKGYREVGDEGCIHYPGCGAGFRDVDRAQNFSHYTLSAHQCLHDKYTLVKLWKNNQPFLKIEY